VRISKNINSSPNSNLNRLFSTFKLTHLPSMICLLSKFHANLPVGLFLVILLADKHGVAVFTTRLTTLVAVDK